jgi:uncharacterized repeat protein (TIGR03803 family)
MKNIMKHRTSISGICLSASSVVLALLIVLVPAIVAAQSQQAQNYKILYTFTGGADGSLPQGELVRDASGNLYGTTYQGGANNAGTVFKVDASGKETVLHSFDGGDGEWPAGGLILDSAGNLYGTTHWGGTGNGVVFKLDPSGTLTVLHDFNWSDGAAPGGSLIRDSAGNLYGTTFSGGAYGDGTVYKLDSTGTETVLYSFDVDGAAGENPQTGVTRDAAGNLYGTTSFGGSNNGWGTIFKLDPTGTLTVLHTFQLGDGANPDGTLIRDSEGNLYGTTPYGGTDNGSNGVVFRLDQPGTLTVLHNFMFSDGAYPRCRLLRDGAGNLYGTAEGGGVYGYGEVFKLDSAGVLTVLHSFRGGKEAGQPAAGLTPYGGALAGTTGNTIFLVRP